MFCQLIERCQQGEPAALVELIERFQGPVFGLCYRMVGHRQDAEDMAQESFVRAIRSLGQWDRSREFLPWLLAIAGNRCRTLLARRRRHPRGQPLVDCPVDCAPNERPAELLGEEVRRALSRIRVEYRQAFLLFHEQHLSYAEIGAALNCPLGTVKTWVHRARQELADELRRRHVLEAANALR